MIDLPEAWNSKLARCLPLAFLVAAAAAICSEASALPQNSGDLGTANALGDTEAMAYTREELIEVVRCLKGDAFADELDAATDPDTGTIKVGEMYAPDSPHGASDHDTISSHDPG